MLYFASRKKNVVPIGDILEFLVFSHNVTTQLTDVWIL